MAVTLLDSWSFVDDDTPHNELFTPSAGTDRVVVLCYCSPNHDISAFGWSVSSVDLGGVSPTATWIYGGASGAEGSNEDDCPRYIALWNDAAIQSIAESPIQFGWVGTTIVNEFAGWATYEGVEQSNLSAFFSDASDQASDGSSCTVATTSSDGERIVVFGGANTDNITFSDTDTLTTIHNVGASSTNGRYHLLEGNGGDNSTVITHTNFRRTNYASIVLKDATVSAGGNVTAIQHHQHGRAI